MKRPSTDRLNRHWLAERASLNQIWMFRRKRGLGQKQVMFLMNLKSAASLSRYERGEKLPNLVNAIKLELALNTPISVLFRGLTEKLQQDMILRRERTVSTRLRDVGEFM